MSNDRYERIRYALAMGPTPGPWEASYDKGSTRDIITQKEKYPICMVRGITYVGQEQYLANGHFIAACDPDTIRSLLDERDALAAEVEALRAEVERLHRILGHIVGGDGDSTVTIRVGTDAFAAAKEYLLHNREEEK